MLDQGEQSKSASSTARRAAPHPHPSRACACLGPPPHACPAQLRPRGHPADSGPGSDPMRAGPHHARLAHAASGRRCPLTPRPARRVAPLGPTRIPTPPLTPSAAPVPAAAAAQNPSDTRFSVNAVGLVFRPSPPLPPDGPP